MFLLSNYYLAQDYEWIKPVLRPVNIILIGLPGAAKTEIGKSLAWHWGLGFIDLGSTIGSSEKKKIGGGFGVKSPAYPFELEEERINYLSSVLNHVIVINGLALQSDKVLKVLKSIGLLVWVDVPISTIAWRLSRNLTELKKHPSLSDLLHEGKSSLFEELQKRLGTMFADRMDRYTAAEIVVRDSGSTPETCARTAMILIEDYLREQAGPNLEQ